MAEEPVGKGGMGRESDRIEGAQRLFGPERSGPSCQGLGSVERSEARSEQLLHE